MKNIISSYKDTLILIGAMIIGVIVGLVWGDGAQVLSPVADLFLNLCFCIVVPLVYISLATSIANMSSGKRVGVLLIVMMCVFLATQLFAAVVSDAVIGSLEPAKGIVLTATEEEVEITQVDFNILAKLTVSDFNTLWSRSNLLAIVVFAVITGFAVKAAGEKGEPVKQLLNSATQVVIKMVSLIMKLAPVCLGCYAAVTVGTYGSSVAGALGKLVLATWIFAFAYFVIVNSAVAFIARGPEGVKTYWACVIKPALTALGTCSSAAAIPSNIEAGEKAGLSEEVNSLVMPMGCNLHKEGACLIVVISISMECSLLGLNIFSPEILGTTIVCAIIGSMITGAIPSGGNVIIMLIISMFGFPASTVPLMILLHTLADAPTTLLNVVGDLSNGMLIQKIMDKIKISE